MNHTEIRNVVQAALDMTLSLTHVIISKKVG